MTSALPLCRRCFRLCRRQEMVDFSMVNLFAAFALCDRNFVAGVLPMGHVKETPGFWVKFRSCRGSLGVFFTMCHFS